jgi:hypothetical protein
MPYLLERREVERYYDGGQLVIVEEGLWQDWAHERPPVTRRHEKRIALTAGEREYVQWLQSRDNGAG